MKDKVSLKNLFFTFAKIGAVSFGGGYAMMPMFIRELSEKRGWATPEELANYFAVSQCTPGVVAVNTATFVGNKHRGVLGGIFATLGLVLPPIVIIIVIATLLNSFVDNPYVAKAFFGIRICVCIMVLNAIIKLWKGSVKGVITFIIFLAAAVLTIVFKLSPVLLVLGVILLGIIIGFIKAPKEEKA